MIQAGGGLRVERAQAHLNTTARAHSGTNAHSPTRIVNVGTVGVERDMSKYTLLSSRQRTICRYSCVLRQSA
jgi:hypothetical protein